MYRQARQNQCRLRQGQRKFAAGINYHAYTDEDIAARRKPSYIWRDSNGISGPIGYSAMVFMNSAGKLAGTDNR